MSTPRVVMSIDVKPFQTPNFVLLNAPVGRREDGLNALPSYPLSDVPAEVLAAMCDEFRRDVFRKAKKADPGAV